tara:strand:+ start:518 stop:898 length:381 start_codon:yes stop_codon:yes gene_type:complete
MKSFKIISIIAMSIFYINVGIKHFTDPNWFLFIIPPYLSTIGLELVYTSGFFEILLGILLLIPRYRRLAAFSLIILLVAVYPANIYLAFNKEPQEFLQVSAFKASWVRLPMQFIFLGLAYWHTRKD